MAAASKLLLRSLLLLLSHFCFSRSHSCSRSHLLLVFMCPSRVRVVIVVVVQFSSSLSFSFSSLLFFFQKKLLLLLLLCFSFTIWSRFGFPICQPLQEGESEKAQEREMASDFPLHLPEREHRCMRCKLPLHWNAAIAPPWFRERRIDVPVSLPPPNEGVNHHR